MSHLESESGAENGKLRKPRVGSHVPRPASGRRGAPRNKDGSFKAETEDPDKTYSSKRLLPAALFSSANIDLNHPIEGQEGRAIETYGDVILRAATAGRAYNIDPMFEVVTQEAAFVKTLVTSMMEDDLSLLSTLEKAKVVDQITRSFDTILRGIEFAQGRADSRPDILLKQATMDMLNDEELAKMEALYVTAHTRTTRITTTRKETHVELEAMRKEDRDLEPQAPPRAIPLLAYEAELADNDDYPRGAEPDYDESKESAGSVDVNGEGGQ